MQEGILCDVHRPISPAADGSIYRRLLGRAQTLTCTPARALKFSYLVGRRASRSVSNGLICSPLRHQLSVQRLQPSVSIGLGRSVFTRIFSCFCLVWFLISSGPTPLAKPRSLPFVTVATIVTVQQVLLSSYLRH